MADMTVQNFPANAVAAPMEAPRLPAGRIGVADEVEVNDAAPRRRLTVAEKLAIIDKAHAKQTGVFPCCAPLIREGREEWEAHIDAKIPAAPVRMTAEDARLLREVRARGLRARGRQRK